MDNSHTSDEQIAAQVQIIPEMFGFLIDRYQAKLDRYILRKTGLEHDLREDVLQEVFIKAYEHIASFDTTLSFNSWIYRICHNTLISDWKKNKRYREGLSIDSTDIGIVVDGLLQEESAEHITDRAILEKAIATVMNSLNEKYRTIVELRYLEDMSYEEISTVLQLPPGTVATRLNRAKKQLAQLLETIKE